MTKDKLLEYRALLRERRHIEDILGDLEAILYSPKNQKLTGMPGSGGAAGNPLENMAQRHLELQDRYRQLISEIGERALEIETAIETVQRSSYRDLLRLRYLKGMRWEEICTEMHYSWRQTHYIHRRALEALCATEDKEESNA